MPTCPRCFSQYPEGTKACVHDGEHLVPDSVLSQPDQTLSEGYKVGEYVIEAPLGSGTFGSVYRGIQPLIGKQVAVKVLSRKYSADPHVVSRFISEARAVNQIRHKNIIDIFSFGQLEDGRHYHVMELLDGQPLDEYLRQKGGRLRLAELLPILRGLARALDAAHAAGIAHRDLKPANVFLARDEDGHPFPKLLDFGIAKLMTDDVPRQHHTATGAAVGTPDYMSPEQCEGPNIDHRTDVYAYGVMTFQLLTGQLPFTGKNVVEVLMKHMTQPPPRPSEVAKDVPETFDAPVLAMLAKARDDRPSSLTGAVEMLELAAAQAGFEFSTSTSGASNPLIQSGPQTRPRSSTSSSAFAPTLGASADIPTSNTLDGRKGRTWGLILGGSAVVLLIGLSFVAQQSGPTEAAPPSPAAVPPPVAVEPPSPPPFVRVWIAGAPKGTSINGSDGQHFGKAPGPIELPTGEKVKLTLEAKGYETLVYEVSATANSTIAVSLAKNPPPKPPRRARRPSRRPEKKPPKPPPTPAKDRDALEEPNW